MGRVDDVRYALLKSLFADLHFLLLFAEPRWLVAPVANQRIDCENRNLDFDWIGGIVGEGLKGRGTKSRLIMFRNRQMK